MAEGASGDFEARIRASFARQKIMETLRVSISRLSLGEIELLMPFTPDFTQQHGFVHAGTIATVLDNACGYAAFTTMQPGSAVLTVEFKANFLAPAKGESFRFVGKTVKAGRVITVCDAQAFSRTGSDEKLIATMTATLMAVAGREGIEH
ncbi:MAG: PaaI family thioesterase [Rhodomicrobium sp.]